MRKHSWSGLLRKSYQICGYIIYLRPWFWRIRGLSDSYHVLTATLMGLRRLCPGGSWSPKPIDVVMVVAGVLYHRREVNPALDYWLSFDCYLRIGKVVRLSRGDVVLPGQIYQSPCNARYSLAIGGC